MARVIFAVFAALLIQGTFAASTSSLIDEVKSAIATLKAKVGNIIPEIEAVGQKTEQDIKAKVEDIVAQAKSTVQGTLATATAEEKVIEECVESAKSDGEALVKDTIAQTESCVASLVQTGKSDVQEIISKIKELNSTLPNVEAAYANCQKNVLTKLPCLAKLLSEYGSSIVGDVSSVGSSFGNIVTEVEKFKNTVTTCEEPVVTSLVSELEAIIAKFETCVKKSS